MDQELSNVPGIGQIGTILGVTEMTLTLPGFDDFVYQTRDSNINVDCLSCEGGSSCNQVCENCTSLNSKDIIEENPTFSFAIQSAVYTFAHALHQVLNCSVTGCEPPREIPPYLVRHSWHTFHYSYGSFFLLIKMRILFFIFYVDFNPMLLINTLC